jgi:ankyrin repeat protein
MEQMLRHVLLVDGGHNIEQPYIAIYGHITVVKELVDERNADVNARDSDGMTALTWARRRNNPIIAAYLISHGGIE